MKIDVRILKTILNKYVSHVEQCEGTDFLDNFNLGNSDVEFTEEELYILNIVRGKQKGSVDFHYKNEMLNDWHNVKITIGGQELEWLKSTKVKGLKESFTIKQNDTGQDVTFATRLDLIKFLKKAGLKLVYLGSQENPTSYINDSEYKFLDEDTNWNFFLRNISKNEWESS